MVGLDLSQRLLVLDSEGQLSQDGDGQTPNHEEDVEDDV